MSEVAIAHKDYVVRGGGERLAEELADVFDAPLVVGRRRPKNEAENIKHRIRELDLTRWQRYCIDHGGLPRAFAYMTAWQSAPLEGYDTVIMSGNEPLWYVPRDEQTVVAYTHSTPRFMYDLFQERDHNLIETWYLTAQRTVYQHNVTRPDLWVANSDLVARRIQRYWNIDDDDIRVVYPPVDVDSFSRDAAPTGDYFLSLGRLAPAKETQQVVRAATKLGVRLKVAGDGPELEAVEEIAGPTVEVLGRVSESEKRELLSGARALIFNARNEDFGMVPVEAFASGTPVLGVNEGFTKYQIQTGKNGGTFERGFWSLVDVIEQFDAYGVEWTEAEIEEFAEMFSSDRFKEGMADAVAEAELKSEVQTEWGKQYERARY